MCPKGTQREKGEGSTVSLYSIVSRLEVSYRIRLGFKCQTPREYPTALVDQLDSDFMPLGPPRIPKMALVEQMKPFWDSSSEFRKYQYVGSLMPYISGNHPDGAFLIFRTNLSYFWPLVIFLGSKNLLQDPQWS